MVQFLLMTLTQSHFLHVAHFYCKCFVPIHSICSHIADTNTQRSVSDPATVLPSVSVALLQTNLLWIGQFVHSPTSIALVHVLGAAWFEDGCSLGLGHFVEERKVCYIFT